MIGGFYAAKSVGLWLVWRLRGIGTWPLRTQPPGLHVAATVLGGLASNAFTKLVLPELSRRGKDSLSNVNPKPLWGGALLTLMLSSMLTARVQAERYVLKGQIDYYYNFADTPSFTRNFEVAVRDCTWAIRVDTLADDPSPVNRFETVYDGSSIYCYTFKDLPADSPFVNNGTATIDKGPIPFEDGSFVNYLWTVYASSCKFYSTTNLEIQPLWLLRRARPHAVRAQVELIACAPYLPAHISYWEHSGQTAAPLDGGWKSGELKVIATTNSQTLCFPAEATYEQYKLDPDATASNQLLRQFRVRILLNSVCEDNTVTILPPATRGVTLIEERRIGESGNEAKSVAYASTNGRLPVSPEQIAIEQHALITASKDTQTGLAESSKPKAITITLMLLTSAVAIAIAALSWKKKTNTQQTD